MIANTIARQFASNCRQACFIRSLSAGAVAADMFAGSKTSARQIRAPSFSVGQRSRMFSSNLKPEWTTPSTEGDKVPDVEFLTRTRVESDDENPFDWKVLTSADYFAGKRVIVFALPGAFTPTCSSTHLPGYEANYDKIKSLGIDEIYCLSVNDAFVMRQWGLAQGLPEDKTLGSLGFENVKLIPDGAAAFTRGMGMSCVWSSNRGFGERSWRYSMVINDGVIEKMFVEQPKIPNSEADPFEVTDCDTMIKYLESV